MGSAYFAGTPLKFLITWIRLFLNSIMFYIGTDVQHKQLYLLSSLTNALIISPWSYARRMCGKFMFIKRNDKSSQIIHLTFRGNDNLIVKKV